MTLSGPTAARSDLQSACGLPAAWAGQPQWRILETGAGTGLHFLSAWRAWKDDPRRPRLLHHVAIDAAPLSADALLHGAAPWPELLDLANELAQQWYGLLPGFHRLAFEGGQVLLTLCVGELRPLLREQASSADTVLLGDGAQHVAWDLHTVKAVARLCRRGTRVAGAPLVSEAGRHWAQCGFVVADALDAAPVPRVPCAQYAPAWEPRGAGFAAPVQPQQCVVIGAGLAGAAVAASLGRRGWQVEVLDAAPAPAAGASSLPAGLLAPQSSPDDNLLSRLSRSGARMTLQQAHALLQAGRDWQPTGVLEYRADGAPRLPAGWSEAGRDWSDTADMARMSTAMVDHQSPSLWHAHAAWLRPAALVAAWLAQSGVSWRGNALAGRVVRDGKHWAVLNEAGEPLARAPLVVVAAAHASNTLLPRALPLQPVRGQVSWAWREAGQALPPFPVNGNGHFIPAAQWSGRAAWFIGSTYDRGDTALAPREADHKANLARVQSLSPAIAAQIAPAFANGSVQAWTGVRCASADRRPLVGPLDDGLWVSTAMGSRGLTFAVLCAELLAARLHGEPLPLGLKLAGALACERATSRVA